MKRFLVLLALVAACGPKKPPGPPKLPPPLRVEIVKPIPREAEFCWGVAEFPPVPDDLYIDFENEDVLRRSMVHYLEYNKMLTWARDLAIWAEAVRECLNDITEFK